MTSTLPVLERPQQTEADYLIIGAGAMGMAFADVVFAEQPGASIVIVDKRARPGGHWNDAYPFVALHQPAAFYGLNSAQLGTGGSDLASGAEIVAYYHRAMQRWRATGRVIFLAQSEFTETDAGSGRVVSLLDPNQVTKVKARKKLVNAAFMNVEVPATHGPRYEVADDVAFIPLNGLAKLHEPWRRYVIIGAGNTGMDAILFLLKQGVAADKIQWIVSHDAWLWNRPSIQPGQTTAELMRQLQAVIEHRDINDVFHALETAGSMHRVRRSATPVKWRCATVDPWEVDALRRIKDVVRLGRVQSISTASIRLDKGSLATDDNSLHVDCTANGLAKLPPQPVFEGRRITMQSLFMCQQVFSAAIIARMSLTDLSDDKLNAICRVVPHPEYVEDLPACLTTSLQNLLDVHRHVPFWLRRSRLNQMHHESPWHYIAHALTARRMLPKGLAAVQNAARQVAG